MIREPGTGEPNAEPLFPLRVGYRVSDGGRYGPSEGGFHIPERVTWRGRSLFRLQLQEDHLLTDVGYSELTADGALVTHLINRAAPLARPLVAIPGQVRDEMVWEAWLDGTLPAFVNQARGGFVTDTPFGPRRLWAIHTLHLDGTSAGGTVYAEGIGRVGVVDLDGNVSFHARIIAPLEEPADTPIEPAPIALEPVMIDGAQLTLAASQTLSLSVLRHPGTRTSTLIHRREEYFPGLCGNLFQPGRPEPLQECYRWADGELEALGSRGGAEPLTAIAHGAEACPLSDASGVHPGPPDVAQRFIPRAPLGQRDGRLATNTTGHTEYVGYLAVLGAAADAEPSRLDTINVNLQTSPYQDRLLFYLSPLGADVGVGAVLGDFFVARLRHDLASFGVTSGAGRAEHEWIASRAIARPRARPSEGADVLLQIRDEMWLALTGISADGPVPVVRPFGARLGNVSVESFGDGQRALLHNRDGVLQELALDGSGGVELRTLGRVETDADEYVVGAVRVAGAGGDDALVVLTGGPPYTDCQAGLIPTTRAWYGSLPEPGPARAPPRIDTVTATPAGLDLLVCWAPGGGAPTLTGWTLGGLPARAIRAASDDSCVFVLRDLAATAGPGVRGADFTKPGAFAAMGSIPGVGSVAIGVGEVVPDWLGSLEDRTLGVAPMRRQYAHVYLWEPFAALAGGGFVSHYSLYGPGMNLEGAPRYGYVYPSPDLRGRPGVVDLAGGGLWVFGGDGTTFLTLLSRDSRRFPVAEPGYLVPIEGGGVLMYTRKEPRGIELTRFGPDGPGETWTLASAELDVRVATSEGTICGRADFSHALACIDPGGVERQLPPEDARLEQLVVGLGRWLPLPGGKIAILQEVWEQVAIAPGESATFVFDPAAMTVQELDTRPVIQVSYGADGRLWGAVLDPLRGGVGVEITDTGFVEIELPFSESSADPVLRDHLRREIGFVQADEDVLIVWPRGNWAGASPVQALSGKVLRLPLPN